MSIDTHLDSISLSEAINKLIIAYIIDHNTKRNFGGVDVAKQELKQLIESILHELVSKDSNGEEK